MIRTHVRQLILVHVATCHSTISRTMFSYFPTTGFKTQNKHRHDTIDTTVPLPEGDNDVIQYKTQDGTIFF